MALEFPALWREWLEMLRVELLTTSNARDIARKGLGRVGGVSGPGATLRSNFSALNDAEGDLGYVGSYQAAAEFSFPDNTTKMLRLTDGRVALEARILANVTGAGKVGSSLLVEVDGGAEARGFDVAPPSISLDEVGLQVSPWRQFALGEEPDEGSRPTLIRWLVSNPGALATGAFSVGLCQLQLR